jgi:hypothetical protein
MDEITSQVSLYYKYALLPVLDARLCGLGGQKKALISINETGPCKQRVKDLFTNTNLTEIPDDQILPMDLYAIFCIPLYYFDADV